MENFGLGACESRPDIRNYRIGIDTTLIDFPETFELEMPTVKNQGQVGSCVAHALSTLIEYFNIRQNNNDTTMSVGYIYGNRPENGYREKGMVTKQAIAHLCSEGDVYHIDFPVNEEVPEIYDMLAPRLEELTTKARPFSFNTYFAVKTPEEIKAVLMKSGPVVIAVDWQKDMKVRNGVVYSEFKEKSGGHCMLLYGWNEKGWLIQNSWGFTWGDGGRAVWPYEYPIREAYGVVDKTTEEELQIKKPFETTTKFGKLCVHIFNYVYATLYGWFYKIKFVK